MTLGVCISMPKNNADAAPANKSKAPTPTKESELQRVCHQRPSPEWRNLDVMDRQTALLVLQLPEAPTPEEIHDAFEAHVFGLRDFLFRQTVIPQVFRAKVDRLLTASEVGETLGSNCRCMTATSRKCCP